MNENHEAIKICPVCGKQLVEIDNMNYLTSICPNVFPLYSRS